MKTLLLFANAFPFGSWEPFLETEVEYYSNFDHVRIFSLSVRDDQARQQRPIANPRVTVHPVRFRSQLFYALAAVRVLFDLEFYREVVQLLRHRRLSAGRLLQLVVFLSRCHHEARVIASMIRREGLVPAGSEVVAYSYRMAYQPYLADLALRATGNRSARRVARAHGADLYEEVAPHGYLPLRSRTLEALDDAVLISEHGHEYLADRHPGAAEKMRVSYLGTVDRGLGVAPADRGVLRVLTCSAVVPVKRLDRLVDALALITDSPVHWTHFGDGALLPELKHRAESLPSNIQVDFRGEVGNQELLDEYAQTPYDVLVNVSRSEGLPVSMMEANSFGIPVVGVDVGGVSEIIDDGVSGVLLPADASAEAIAGALLEVAEMDESRYSEMRRSARLVWERKFNADDNYARFAQELAGA